ncbi:uncharacterized protein CG1339 [Drosophila busckii]|uniref:uncharacterized protein CG1339 n=1 Tax=Drosophila busckii TaxID=30019 RepID=UPI00083EDC7D|nr:uncharacterized protein CG1339 [Drosophila busckii]
MWSTRDSRFIRSRRVQAVYRRFFQYSAMLIYFFARVLDFVRLKYDCENHRMQKFKHHILIVVAIVIYKLYFVINQCHELLMFYQLLRRFVYIVDESQGQYLFIFVLSYAYMLIFEVQIHTLCYYPPYCEELKYLINEILSITRIIEERFGLIYYCDAYLLGLNIMKLYLSYMYQLDLLNRKGYSYIIQSYWMLFEYVTFAYFIYQLLLLNWQRSLVFFLQRCIEHPKRLRAMSSKYRNSIQWILHLNTRISKLHDRMSQTFSWINRAVYSNILTSINNMELMLECIIYSVDEIDDKIHIVLNNLAAPAVLPILNIFIIGILMDKMRTVQEQLQLQIVIINAIYYRLNIRFKNKVQEHCYEFTSLLLEKKLKPFRNISILDNNCDRVFVLNYFMTIMTTTFASTANKLASIIYNNLNVIVTVSSGKYHPQ